MSTTSLLVQSLPVLAQGAVLTVKFAVLSMVFGLLGAVVLAMMGIRQSEALEGFERIWVNALAWLARGYVSLMRGTPLLVQIFVIYYGLPSLGISLDPTPAGVIALSANVAAYMSESMRGAINGIARGQWLAAYSLGLSWSQTLRYVIGPQALRIAVPSLSNSLISLIKGHVARVGDHRHRTPAQRAGSDRGDLSAAAVVSGRRGRVLGAVPDPRMGPALVREAPVAARPALNAALRFAAGAASLLSPYSPE